MQSKVDEVTETWVRGLLRPAESLAIVVVAAIMLADALLVSVRGIAVVTASFLPHAVIAAALLVGALAYRKSGRSEPIALALMACAILVGFTNAGAVLNYLTLPAGRAPIDATLARADAALGFDWRAFATRLAEHPTLASVLRWVYLTSLAQMTVAIVYLGLTGRAATLHRFLFCGIIASLASIAFWSAFPSIGPASWARLDPQTAARLGRVLGDDYAREMTGLLQAGVASIAADRLIGLIAFPSMHTVMMCMAIWYLRGTRAFPLIVVVNTPMIPAILLHGSHNLVDVLGGLLVFALAADLSARIVSATSDRSQSGPRLQGLQQPLLK